MLLVQRYDFNEMEKFGEGVFMVHIGLPRELAFCCVLQIVGKTVQQQKLSKDYSQKVQAYNSMVALKRREKTKAGKAKRTGKSTPN